VFYQHNHKIPQIKGSILCGQKFSKINHLDQTRKNLAILSVNKTLFKVLRIYITPFLEVFMKQSRLFLE